MYITAIAGSGEDVWDQTKIRLSQEYKNLKETKIIINGDLAPLGFVPGGLNISEMLFINMTDFI